MGRCYAAFFCYQPASSIVVVPIASQDVPFIFNEISADFQALTVQGQFTYRIHDPQRIASLLNYTVEGQPSQHISDDPRRMVSLASLKTPARSET